MCRHILASGMYRNAGTVGGYVPMPRETDVTAVLLDVLASGRTLALPLCGESPEMTFRRVCSLDDLVSGRYGIMEPRPDAEEIDPGRIDLLLVPLEGVDRSGMRLGKGGGYYDRLLSGVNVVALGCALSTQWTDCVPAQPWDRPLSACADRDGIHLFNTTNK